MNTRINPLPRTRLTDIWLVTTCCCLSLAQSFQVGGGGWSQQLRVDDMAATTKTTMRTAALGSPVQQEITSCIASVTRPNPKRSLFPFMGRAMNTDDLNREGDYLYHQQIPWVASSRRAVHGHVLHAGRSSSLFGSTEADVVHNDSTTTATKRTSNTAYSSSPTSTTTTLAVKSKVVHAMVRRMAMFLAHQLEPRLEVEVDQQEQQQRLKLLNKAAAFEKTVRATQIAQEKLGVTWKAAGKAVQQYQLLAQWDNEVISQPTITAVAAATPAAAPPASFATLPTESPAIDGMDDQSDPSVFLSASHGAMEENDVNVDSAPTGNEAASPIAPIPEIVSSAFADVGSIANGPNDVVTVEQSTQVGESDNSTMFVLHSPGTASKPRIPSIISMEFGKPLPVIDTDIAAATAIQPTADHRSKEQIQQQQQQQHDESLDGGMGMPTTFPPSMSLLSNRRSETIEMEEAVTSRSSHLIHVDSDDRNANDDEISHVDKTSSDLVAVADEESPHSATKPQEPVEQQLMSEEEKQLAAAARYASISNLGARAFQILLDLGMIHPSPDPDDANYDHSNDDELCADNVWVQNN